MNSDWLPLGSIEPIEVFAVDGAGAPITGMVDLFIAIRRVSDGKWLDWNDGVFKAVGWVARLQVMVEFDPVLSPGFYRVTFDTSPYPNPDNYIFTIDQVPPTVFPQQVVAELRVGGVPDDCVTTRKCIDNRDWVSAGAAANRVIYDDDDITPFRTYDITDPSAGAIVIPPGTPTRKSKGY